MEAFRTEIPNHFSLPRRLSRLGELAYNLWWTWNPEAQRLFSNIDKGLWESVYHNPVIFLRQVARSRLNAAMNNRDYLESFDRIFRAFDQYMKEDETWFTKTYPELRHRLIAYFSMEFGLHETLPIYAGGLGILSGDHAKEASDLGLPFVAIGFFYTEGYFTQRITEDGWQEAQYISHPLDELPVLPVFDENDVPVTISVQIAGREVFARLWEVHVGRVPLYLLDTNIESNAPQDRALSARLYSGDPEMRVSQEILLGIGGLRALRKLGYNPSVWHMNEGHAAFLILERIYERIQTDCTFEEAADLVRPGNVFTTHTPVPAGNDEFAPWVVDKYFSQLWPELKLDRDQFMALAQHTVSWGNAFSMTALALRFSEGRNAVSELHGQVSRRMWAYIWPKLRLEEIPITHITNGVHTGTWLARRLRMLYDRYLGTDWLENADDADVWELINNIPDEQLWMVRRHLKRKLTAYMGERARRRWTSGGWHPAQVVAGGVLLDPYALTLGFARRFAPYKRADLILSDIPRLMKLVNNSERPVQIIFAGKSHPDHEAGKLLIQEVYRIVKRPDGAGRLVFLEDYDLNLARYLIQGVDVWVNTPRRPNEASGTSGQKAALNGVLNFSVLDGWWREGYNGQNGWAIGEDVDYENPDQQDAKDAASLYDILENEIIPLYYELRSSDGLPVEWIGRIKASIRTLAPQFSTRRMVKEYVERMYLPAMEGVKTPEMAS
jgi:starch phosphorylase